MPISKQSSKLQSTFLGVVTCSALLLATSSPAHAAGPCVFERKSLQFQGTTNEQAGCLLREVRPWGKLGEASTALPPTLKELVGQSTADLKERLRKLLTAEGANEQAVGGPLDSPVSRANAGAPSAPYAKFFVIHDTSSPWVGDAELPSDDAASVNSFKSYAKSQPAAHIFINRRGETMLGHDISVPWRATKFENKVIGIPAKGLFLHVELIQPRKRDPLGGPKNDAIAPKPGFTQAQYDKLALVYAAASARRGAWLVPAFHAVIDAGLNDAHDDPQNFELSRFDNAVKELRDRLSR